MSRNPWESSPGAEEGIRPSNLDRDARDGDRSRNFSLDFSQHALQTQQTITREELIDSISATAAAERQYAFLDDDSSAIGNGAVGQEEDTGDDSNLVNDQPTMEQIQKVYYAKGLEELESLKLLDLSPLANWKLSSSKPGFGLSQLRDDSPETYWQSDGSNGSGNSNSNNGNIITNNQLSNPHTITIQFSKKVSLERISLFTNYNLDESYTPSKIKIMAGSSDGWDLSEVCVVNFNKPVGWSHIIFNGIRNDGVLKCFMVKLIILANHQDGKDTHIRLLKCFGKKSGTLPRGNLNHPNMSFSLTNEELLKDLSLTSAMSASGYALNYNSTLEEKEKEHDATQELELDASEASMNKETEKLLNNASNVIGFNSGFQSLELKSVSSIR